MELDLLGLLWRDDRAVEQAGGVAGQLGRHMMRKRAAMLHYQLHGVSLALCADTLPEATRPAFAAKPADGPTAASAHAAEQAAAHAKAAQGRAAALAFPRPSTPRRAAAVAAAAHASPRAAASARAAATFAASHAASLAASAPVPHPPSPRGFERPERPSVPTLPLPSSARFAATSTVRPQATPPPLPRSCQLTPPRPSPYARRCRPHTPSAWPMAGRGCLGGGGGQHTSAPAYAC